MTGGVGGAILSDVCEGVPFPVSIVGKGVELPLCKVGVSPGSVLVSRARRSRGEGTSGNYCKQSMDRRNVRNVYY